MPDFHNPTCLPLAGCYLTCNPSISDLLGLPSAAPLVPRRVSKDLSLETDAQGESSTHPRRPGKDHLCQSQTLLLLGCFMSGYSLSSQS